MTRDAGPGAGAGEVVVVETIGPDDWADYRVVRLAALQADPDAFGSTYALEVDRDEAAWREVLDRPESVRMLARSSASGAVVGTVGAYVRRERDVEVPEIVAMWVAPEARGTGAGRTLVEAVVGWAQSEEFTEIRLMVNTGNVAAERFYERLGFVHNGYRQPMPHRPDETEDEMVRAV